MKHDLRVLIVDDDEDDKMLFIEAVKELDIDIECIGANDGQQALQFLNNEQNALPDYIFLDLRMPRISGRRCLEEIKKNDRLQKIPVVVYTTSKEPNDAMELRELGAAHFFTKPTNPDEIYYMISFVLQEFNLTSTKN